MDPTTCWRHLIDALSSGDPEDAIWSAIDLCTWLNQDGAMPDTGYSSATVHAFLHVILCELPLVADRRDEQLAQRAEEMEGQP